VGPGGAVEMTHSWLRETIVPLPSDKDRTTPPPPAPPNPQQKLDDQIANFAYWLDYLATVLETVRSVKDHDSMTLIDRVGWPPEQARHHIELLDRMAKDLHYWQRVAELATIRPATEIDSGDGEVADEAVEE
jgi:hypothetical protein